MALSGFFPARRRSGILGSGPGERPQCPRLGFLRHLDLYGPSLVGHHFSFDFFRPGRPGDRGGKIARDHRGGGGNPCRSRIRASGTREGTSSLHPFLWIEFPGHGPRLALVDHHHPEQHGSPGARFRQNPGMGKFGMDGSRMAGQHTFNGSVCIGGMALGRGQHPRRRLLLFASPLPPAGRSPEERLGRLGLKSVPFVQATGHGDFFWDRISFFHPPFGLLHAHAPATAVPGLRTNRGRNDGRAIDRGGCHAPDGMAAAKMDHQVHIRPRPGLRNLALLALCRGGFG